MSGGSKKEQTIGYKYFASVHMVLCHGPIDNVKKILVDEDITLIEGKYTSGDHIIDKPDLFGGEKKQGGISGTLSIIGGDLDQPVHPKLRDLQSADAGGSQFVPSYRGVTSLLLSGMKKVSQSVSPFGIADLIRANSREGMYLGMNPYLKTWKTLVQRVFSTSDGSEQWYKAKAAIPSVSSPNERVMFQVAIDSSGSMQGRRLELVKVQLLQLLDFFLMYAGDSILDLSFLTWGGYNQSSIEKFNSTAEDIQEIKDWINNISAGGGTDFADAFRRANPFFQPLTIRSNTEKYMFFITDGLPDSTASADQAAASNRAMIDGTGVWSFSPVTITGFNIDLSDTSQTRKVVNNSVYVISSENDSGMVEAAQAAFSLVFWDMNPAHIIRECLVNRAWGNQTPEYEIDNQSFIEAADALYREGFGMSIKWTQEGAVDEFIQEVLRHINAVIYEDNRSGLITLKLIRSDYNYADLPVLSESEITSVSDFQKSSFSELINQITVTYTDVLNGADGTVTVQDSSLIAIQGETNSKSIKYTGFSNIKNAGRAAMRDLKSYATPLISAEITMTRRSGINFRQGDVFRWSWSKYAVDDVVMRVAAIGLGNGRDNKVTLTCVEDIFSLPESTVTAVQPPAPKPSKIEDIKKAISFEVPYLELVQQSGEAEVNSLLERSPEIGFYGVAAARPLSGGTMNAELYLTSLVSGNYILDSTVNFCPNFTLVENMGLEDAEIIIPVSAARDFSLINIEEDLPVWGQIGEEIISIYEISQVGETDSIQINFKRGVLDTVPKKHSVGSVCYIWDVMLGYSETQFVEGEIATGKLLNQSISASTELANAIELPVEFKARAFRPYPPANVLINGEYFPERIESPMVINWVDRNRLQQTGGDYIGWYDGPVTVESGVTYRMEIERYSEDDTLIATDSFDLGYTNTAENLAGAYFIGVRIYSVRDGVDCLQPFYWKTAVNQDFSAPYDLRAEIDSGPFIPTDFGKPYNIKYEVDYD